MPLTFTDPPEAAATRPPGDVTPMNTKQKPKMKTIAPEIIRCKVHADMVHLEEAAIRPGLAVQHERPHSSFASEPGDFHHMFNAAQGVFGLTYFCKRDCITFLFDAWSATTRDRLVWARDHGGLVITLLGKGGRRGWVVAAANTGSTR